jgi:NADH-quinone oxidoreductase subunit L
MNDLLWMVPILPLTGFLIQFVTAGKLPRLVVAFVGAGSVGLSALIVALIGIEYLQQPDPVPYTLTLYSWMDVGGFKPGFSFYLDGLSLLMMFVITGVGFLIHVYSTLFMFEDESYARFFSYMNLFVSAMLVLVLADNLLLLYLGWEGVGLCSYLLIGFWHTDPANGAAARKAFVVTRIGDTAMALGMFLLFTQLGTLDIQPLMTLAGQTWQTGDAIPTIACLLILGGAVGKSAQLPLQTWLPDAMAGPTPVSALIHAATMVTAGVYLIARTHELFLLAPTALMTVAFVGLITLIMAAFTAMTQTDIKRILAYSTISQIGYMFLALGVSAWSSGIFHLMTHAFFKALLFLGAGAVVYSLHHEHNIFKMGGLRKKLPVPFWCFMIGSAALAGFPYITSGFWSKDEILLSAWEAYGDMGPLLWAGGAFGALLTAIYSFRLVFVVFFGEVKTEPSEPAGLPMTIPLIVLCVLALIGGAFHVPVDAVFPVATMPHHGGTVFWITAAIPLIGIFIAWLIWYKHVINIEPFTTSGIGTLLNRFLFSHWAMDWIYDVLVVRPYKWIAAINKDDAVDFAYNGTASLAQFLHRRISATQTGQLRWYAATMATGLVLVIAILMEFI